YLLELVLLRMANLSLRHGNHESSSVAYSALNMALGSHFSDYGTAYRLGQIACDLVDRRGMDRYKARVYCCFAAFAMPWVQPVSRCLALLRTSFRDSLSVGDAGFAAYTSSNLLTHLLVSGQPLDQVEQEIERTLAFVRGVELGMEAERFITHRELVRSLRGLPAEHRPADDAWASQDVEPRPQLAMRVCYYWIFRLQERYFAGDFAAALQAAAHVGGRRWTLRSTLEEAEYDFYAALAHAASADQAAPAQRGAHLQALLEHHGRIAFWAENCPDNFAHREALIGAEIARLQGRVLEAESLYEQALQLAARHGFVQCEAIASELAGKCHAARGLRTVADAYLLNARRCHERWGAVAKVRQLDARYPHLRALAVQTSLAATISRPLAQLDVETVDKASQTLSSETALPRLVAKLMRLALEHSAAQRGLLVLLQGGEPRIEAEASSGAGGVEVALRNAPLGPLDLPASALRYVVRTRERVVLDDASAEGLDPEDDYVRAMRPRSVLCLPVFKEAEVVGVLYLENNLATGAFTPDRVAVLDFLGSQAAIALENARLYSDLRRSQAWLTEAQHLSLTGSFYWCVASDEVEFSEQAFRIYELDPNHKVTLATIVSRFHPEDLALFHEMVAIARGPAADLDYRYRVQMPDQSIKHLRLVAHATRDPQGPLAYIGAIQDVSQNRRAEEALGKARSELAHVSRVTSLGALTASIAHEVNQPLTGIVTNASTCIRMLAGGPSDLDGPRETLRRIIRDANRAADVIRRLRALFGKGATMCEPVDLNAAAREVIALSSTELQHARITLRAELSEDPPTVMGDRVQLQQVILNLLLNACEAMGPVVDRPRQLMLRTAIGAGEDVVVSVQDTGVGIDREQTERLFEAFYTTKKDGMGIGLSVSRSIVEIHGGRLWARPNEGPGATFSFSIPRQPGRTEHAAASGALRHAAAPRRT
ncbi:ATP-binding protein, partial [Streptococcus pyogenes]|uniref:GAF domain-containing sensor histidine kinase n=1 Tax=Streptococcus pyogenes TaxID=1314 RepID=UPI003DA1BDB0